MGGRNPGVVAQRALCGWREPELRANRGASLPQPLKRLERRNGVAEFVQQIVAIPGVDIREKDFVFERQAGVVLKSCGPLFRLTPSHSSSEFSVPHWCQPECQMGVRSQ